MRKASFAMSNTHADAFATLTTQEPYDFGAPFNDDDADIILRSSDLADFHVHKIFLSKASPIFRSLLSSSAMSNSMDTSWKVGLTIAHREGILVVCCPESRNTLRIILAVVYGIPIPSTEFPEQTFVVLAAAQNYKMHATLALLRGLVKQNGGDRLLSENPFAAYCLAWRYRLKEEAVAAARATLDRPMSIESLGEDLCLATGPALYELVQCRERIVEAFRCGIQQLLQPVTVQPRSLMARMPSDVTRQLCSAPTQSGLPQWLSTFLSTKANKVSEVNQMQFHVAFLEHQRSGCQGCCDMSPGTTHRIWMTIEEGLADSLQEVQIQLEFVDAEFNPDIDLDPPAAFPRDFGEPFNEDTADIILRSCDLVDFRVHKAYLASASSIFRDMFKLPRNALSEQFAVVVGAMDDEKDGIAVVCVAETSGILHGLLSIILPVPISLPTSFENAAALFAAAHKYDMSRVHHLLWSWMHTVDNLVDTTNPFRAYALASRYMSDKDVLQAALKTLEDPMTFSHYGADICLVSGSTLYKLLQYRMRCRKVAHACIMLAVDGHSPSVKTWQNTTRKSKSKHPTERFTCRSGYMDNKSPKWWNEYVRGVAKRVESGALHPSGKSIARASSFRVAVEEHVRPYQDPTSCVSCMATYTLGGDAFCAMLEAEIHSAILKVSFEV
ncbi:hypothetical protein BV25DRAFT_1991891 [Artomyces pyxidatus]|uniref:Uncharacterized protein n=1 Tax=Artomyces pyxidatus TaxID=48021 RepID=A0ACB8SZK6_9AGAM|nr:hypothetical protein BV25DRAFT_1991891 [Artomyces pyxidatus]